MDQDGEGRACRASCLCTIRPDTSCPRRLGGRQSHAAGWPSIRPAAAAAVPSSGASPMDQGTLSMAGHRIQHEPCTWSRFGSRRCPFRACRRSQTGPRSGTSRGTDECPAHCGGR